MIRNSKITLFNIWQLLLQLGGLQRIDRREDCINLSSFHARPQFMVFSTHPNASSTAVGNEGDENVSSSVQSNLISSSSSGHVTSTTHTGISSDQRSFMSWSSLPTQDRAGPSEFQSFSESWKSRLNGISMKYKKFISKHTRGWKEKLFSKGSRMAYIGSEVRREPNPVIATVTRLMEHFETRNNNRASCDLLSNDPRNPSVFLRSSPDNRNAPNNATSSTSI